MLISSFFIIERILEVGNDDAIRWVLRSYPQQDQLNQNARFKDILPIYSGVYGSAFSANGRLLTRALNILLP